MNASKDVLPCIEKDFFSVDTEIRTLLCPTCGGTYNHTAQSPYTREGHDNYKAQWGGRGDLLVIPMEGECGSKWEFNIGFHKGASAVFVSITESCKS